MHIVTKAGENVVYQQQLPDSSTLNATVGFLMQQIQGDLFTTTVTNNGHDLVFKTDKFDREGLVRVVNGLVLRKRGGAS